MPVIQGFSQDGIMIKAHGRDEFSVVSWRLRDSVGLVDYGEREHTGEQCWAVTSYCNLVTVIILLFAVTSY